VNVVAHSQPKDREELTRLAEEQAALRRVATLVAEGASSADVFGAVAHEVAQVTHLPIVGVFRYDGDAATMTVIADWSDRPHAFQPGTTWPLDGHSMTARVLHTGRPVRSRTTRISRARLLPELASQRSKGPPAPRSSSTGGSGG
jgi:hypothetical protein